MKEFIDKLIERLEELQQCQIEKYTKSLGKGNLACIYDKTDIEDAKVGAVWKVLDIVTELAEEYINCSTDTSTNTSTGWIPCSERLPEEPFGCLVTVMDCEPMTQTDFENILPYHVGYDGETWNDADGNVVPFEVIAWMPLPAPFEEGE